ncbi:MAG: hypothetical protein P8M60_06040 [Flavobacteriaceae bacterium]|nr:hypothetical protein [Flavobacteriaceae bacterium]
MNLTLPLFIYTLVIRVTGDIDFGNFIFKVFVVNLLWVLIDFNQSVTGIIDLKKKGELIISYIIFSRLFTSIIIFPFFLLFFFDSIIETLLVYLIILGKSFNVNFYYIFLKKEKELSFINLLSRLGLALIIYLLMGINLLSFAVYIGVAEIIISALLLRNLKINIFIVEIKIIFQQLKRNLNSGSSTFLSSCYSFVPIIFLKFYSPISIADFSIVEKVFRGLSNISAPINNILLVENSNGKTLSIKKLYFLIFLLFSFTLLVVFKLSDIIYPLLFNTLKADSVYSLNLSLLIPLIVFVSRFLVINVILDQQKDKILPLSYMLTLIISVIINYFLVVGLDLALLGSILSIICTEIICMLILLSYSKSILFNDK